MPILRIFYVLLLCLRKYLREYERTAIACTLLCTTYFVQGHMCLLKDVAHRQRTWVKQLIMWKEDALGFLSFCPIWKTKQLQRRILFAKSYCSGITYDLPFCWTWYTENSIEFLQQTIIQLGKTAVDAFQTLLKDD